MNRLFHRDMVPSLFLIGIGSYAVFEATSMSTFGAIFPQLAGGGMLLGGVVLAAGSFAFATPTQKPEGGFVRPLILLSILIGWAVAFPLIGFIPASILGAGLVMLTAMQERIPLVSLLYQFIGLALLVVLIAVLFEHVLNVPLS